MPEVLYLYTCSSISSEPTYTCTHVAAFPLNQLHLLIIQALFNASGSSMLKQENWSAIKQTSWVIKTTCGNTNDEDHRFMTGDRLLVYICILTSKYMGSGFRV